VALALFLLLVGVAGRSVAGAATPTNTAPPAAAAGSDWTVYHGDQTGSGVAPGTGQVVSSGRVYVATENDTVDALDGRTGKVVWSTHLGAPVSASELPCGNIQPSVGITGTPVIDPARDEVFVVAEEMVQGAPAHLMVGLSTTSGKVQLTENVDPPGADPAALLQRTGLTLDGGKVVFGFGGNYGDCGSYHGWVVAVAETGGTPVRFEIDAGTSERQGAVWMGGAAPVVDAAGNVWVSVGNGSVTSSRHTYDNSDSVLELSPALSLLQYFAPTSWPADNAADLDFSTAPVLLAGGEVVISGKSQIAYLLDGAHLGGIGGQQALLRTGCGNDIDGGNAVVGATIYLPCLNGPIAIGVTGSPAGLRLQWRAPVGGGPPIVAAGRVWSIGQDGVLYGLDPATGAVRQQASIGVPANHFPTPGIGDDLLLAPAANRVIAFAAGPLATPTTTAPTTSTTTRATTPPRSATPAATESGLPAGALAGIAVAGAAVLAAVVWLLWRRRRSGSP
jgi:outer membrane protein assembly factor BamB